MARDKGERQRGQLSDKQWDLIEKASGLPSKARKSIELGIRSYLALQKGGSRPPAKIRGELRKLRNQATELFKSVEQALGKDDVYLALVSVRSGEWHPRNLEQRKHLAEHHRTEKVKADLKALIDWLEQSERQLSRNKPGPSTERAESVYLFVECFENALHHHKAKRLTRSYHHRKMMEEVFAILDRKVGRGTIDTAMRRVIAASKSRSAGKLLPGSHVSLADVGFGLNEPRDRRRPLSPTTRRSRP